MAKFFITLGIIAYIAFMLWLIWVIYSRMTARKIMREGRNKKNFAFNYMSTRFSRLNTLRNVKLLIRDPKVQGGRYIADIGLVFVNKGGIILIDTVPGSGFIDITEGGQWNRVINDKYYTFDDPYFKSKRNVHALKTFLRSEGVENIPVHDIVLFSGKRVKFSKKIDGLVTAEELAPYVSDINKDKFLTSGEIRRVVKMLKKMSA
ncbi:MAG: NERD domain-containing protein [Clostridia bacterium]|nr:NERD domain-containing protein [Oscillospiraceae bacterium]MBQ6701794.1 NERD domain-containing protein [Clostridia bacterium]